MDGTAVKEIAYLQKQAQVKTIRIEGMPRDEFYIVKPDGELELTQVNERLSVTLYALDSVFEAVKNMDVGSSGVVAVSANCIQVIETPEDSKRSSFSTLSLNESIELNNVKSINGKAMPIGEFKNFLEDHLNDFVSASDIEKLEQVEYNKHLRGNIRNTSNEKALDQSLIEQVKGKGSSEPIKVLVLQIPAFDVFDIDILIPVHLQLRYGISESGVIVTPNFSLGDVNRNYQNSAFSLYNLVTNTIQEDVTVVFGRYTRE